MKTLDLKKIFRLYLPSLAFIGVFVTYAIASNMTLVNIVAVCKLQIKMVLRHIRCKISYHN
jgi:hypothetical protein